MKKSAFALLALLSVAPAFADGFVCQSQDGLVAKVYDHTDPSEGTRKAAVLVLSNSNVGDGNKTIARFTDAAPTLSNDGTNYVANVDLRYNDSGSKGKLIGGTKLGQLKTIELNVNFSYVETMGAGEETEGRMTLTKRNGEEITIDMECTRYLKN